MAAHSWNLSLLSFQQTKIKTDLQLIIPVGFATPKWEVFKTAFPVFDDQPRTLQEAKAKGWTMISNDCSNKAK